MNNLGDSTLLDTLSALQARRQQQEQFNAGIDQQNASREQQGDMARFGDMAQQRNTMQGQAFQTGQAEAERNWQKESLEKHLAAAQENSKRAYAFKTEKEAQDAKEAAAKLEISKTGVEEKGRHNKAEESLGEKGLAPKIETAHAGTSRAKSYDYAVHNPPPRTSANPKDPSLSFPPEIAQEFKQMYKDIGSAKSQLARDTSIAGTMTDQILKKKAIEDAAANYQRTVLAISKRHDAMSERARTTHAQKPWVGQYNDALGDMEKSIVALGGP